ncbi:hypothetical protein [Ignicoccus hospitalis]|uniref:DUF2029 domain-containing protein n=1 Tax=Ignicoccus hospitalis (strain KIN4/I / DSM 18386 / JCM 14125) TaxID=453591 RepID=A8AAE2_IGNH4|nr:hypothetical protein [Ignicoccus hospitalis]ABU81894.1 hypothetical protein Igni_0712 [Ignicoccus hospitalis KIN4/I]HIH89948.1 hypothetical protein [Desulfurococcaceae archaeon]
MRAKGSPTFAALAALAIIAFAISGNAWDTFVFIKSAILVCEGQDAYSYSEWVGARLPGIGPMWIAYPPLPILLWLPPVCALRALNVPLSLPYLWAIKLPSVLALITSALVAEKVRRGSWKYVIFNPVSLSAVFLHGMFDSITALFVLLSILLVISNKTVVGGLSYGLALTSKQHSLILLPSLAFSFLKKKDVVSLGKFVIGAFVSFASVILLYGFLTGEGTSSLRDLIAVTVFHANRPPNALGFGGFPEVSLYTDVLGGYSGNLANAVLMHGSAVTLHSVITPVSALYVPMLLAVSYLFELPTAAFLAYVTYIQLTYVGALQHLVVPATLLPIVLNDKKFVKYFTLSFLLYSLAHVIAFWDIFPMIFSPLFLASFDLWLSKLSRISDVVLPGWDMAFKLSGSLLTVAGLLVLLYATFRLLELKRRALGVAFIATYLIEMTILILMLKWYASSSELPAAKLGERLCAVYPWENVEFPGERLGDYLFTKSVPPKEGYFSLVKPITDEVAESAAKGGFRVLVIARLDSLRSYEVSDLLASLTLGGVEWAWGVVVSDEDKYYIDGVASAPLKDVGRLAEIIRRNVPLKGYFELGGILGFLNQTIMKIEVHEYEYPTVDGKPIVYVIPEDASPSSIKEVVRELSEKGLAPVVVTNVEFANVKSDKRCMVNLFRVSELSTS